MKHNPGMGETASQPVPAQTADLSISGLRFISPLCNRIVLSAMSVAKERFMNLASFSTPPFVS